MVLFPYSFHTQQPPHRPISESKPHEQCLISLEIRRLRRFPRSQVQDAHRIFSCVLVLVWGWCCCVLALVVFLVLVLASFLLVFVLVSFFLVFGLLSFLLSFCCGVPSFRIGSGPARVRQVGPVRAESALALPCKRGWWPVVLSVRIRQGMAPHASASINAGTCSACGEKYQLVHNGPVDIPCGIRIDGRRIPCAS